MYTAVAGIEISYPGHAMPMKKDIHPAYYPEARVQCACSNTFTVGSTKSSIEVEICSHCHPFYTGKEKIIDTAGRVERYKRLVAKKATFSARRGKAAKNTH